MQPSLPYTGQYPPRYPPGMQPPQQYYNQPVPQMPNQFFPPQPGGYYPQPQNMMPMVSFPSGPFNVVPTMNQIQGNPLLPFAPTTMTTSTIVRAPTAPATGPPPGWKPTITSTSGVNSLMIQPITLYIGKIPPQLDDQLLEKVLQCFGRIQKWNRPIDVNTQSKKAFGFITFEYGINALKCLKVLSTIDIYGAPLQIKAGTKEQVTLDAIAEEEELTTSTEVGPDGEIITGQDEINLLNEQIKVKILELLQVTKPTQLTTDASQSAIKVDKGEYVMKVDVDAMNPGDEDLQAENLNKSTLTEIEKFRLRQAERDKELEKKKLAKLRDKIIAFQEKKDKADAAAVKASLTTSKATSSTSAANYGELLIDMSSKPPPPVSSNRASSASSLTASTGNTPTVNNSNRRSREADLDDDEYKAIEEAKKRRKQQVLEMLAGDADAGLPSQVAVKVKLSSTNVAPATTKHSNHVLVNAQEEDESKKPVRAFVPIDYSEEELKEVSLYRHDNNHDIDDDSENLDGTMKRSQNLSGAMTGLSASSMQANLQEQIAVINKAQAAQARAAEIAAKISSTVSTLTPEEQLKARQKQLVDQIPIEKSKLFVYPIDWSLVRKHSVIITTMKPWITKKVVEYLGEEEETLINFIVSKLENRCDPNELMSELSDVLDDDTEQFVVKLWRMFIFSIVSKTL